MVSNVMPTKHNRITCTDLKHPQTKVKRASHLADSIWIILISFSNSHDSHDSHGGFSVLGCRVHNVHAAFCAMFWTPLDLSCSGALRLKTKFGPQPKQAQAVWQRVWQICAKYVQIANAFDIHFMHCASCYQTFSMCFFRFCRTLSQAFGTVTGISCILAQVTTFQAASSFGRKPSQSNYTLCQSSSLSSLFGGRNEQRQGKEPAS